MISVEIHCVTAVTVFVSAFATLKSVKSCAFSAKARCNAAVSMCYSSDCEIVFGENVVWKRQKCMRFRRKCCAEMVVWIVDFGGFAVRFRGFGCLVSL